MCVCVCNSFAHHLSLPLTQGRSSSYYIIPGDSVVCCIAGADFTLILLSSPSYSSLLTALAGCNSISDRVSVQSQGEGHWCHTHLVWDVLVCDLVTPQGTLCQGVLEKIAHVRSVCVCVWCVCVGELWRNLLVGVVWGVVIRLS